MSITARLVPGTASLRCAIRTALGRPEVPDVNNNMTLRGLGWSRLRRPGRDGGQGQGRDAEPRPVVLGPGEKQGRERVRDHRSSSKR
ncbi:hypothetical protein [Nonomuraea sp. B5E05]|uniref:hypothetical protein n=1 Tax=Nonomuraea sp. B5E05 TaxID=3153569 RepID=UPI0032616E34